MTVIVGGDIQGWRMAWIMDVGCSSSNIQSKVVVVR